MRKITSLLVVILWVILMVPPKKVKAQADEIAQLTLNIQKLAQFRAILKDMKAGYEILNGGYNTIKNLSEGNFKIHKNFLDGLMEVSPEVKKYRKVAEIIQYQSRLVKDYQKAWGRFQHSEVFKPSEIQYLSGVYARLLKSSLKNLDELTLVVTASKLRMSDDERIQSIDRIHADVLDKLNFLHHFNARTHQLNWQRTLEKRSIGTLKSIHGIDSF